MPIDKSEDRTRQCRSSDDNPKNARAPIVLRRARSRAYCPTLIRPAGAGEAGAENFTARQPLPGHPVDVRRRALLSCNDLVAAVSTKRSPAPWLAHIRDRVAR